MEAELQKKKEDILNLERFNEELRKSKRGLKDSKRKLEADLAKNQENISTLEMLNKELERSKEDLEESKWKLEAEVLKKQESITALEESNKELEIRINILEKNLAEGRKKTTDLEELRPSENLGNTSNTGEDSQSSLDTIYNAFSCPQNISCGIPPTTLENHGIACNSMYYRFDGDVMPIKNKRTDELTASCTEIGFVNKAPTMEQAEYNGLGMWHERNDELIMIIGGRTESENGSIDSVIALDPSTSKRIALKVLPEPRCQFGVGVLNERVYVAGGGSEKRSFLRTVISYDIYQDRWISIAPMSTERLEFNVAIMDSLIVAIGGYPGSVSKSVEALDPRQEWWMALPSITTPRWGHVVACINGSIYAIGGYNHSEGELQTVEIYDHRAGKWRLGPNLSSPRAYAGGARVGKSIVVFGGEDGPNVLGTAEILCNGSWEYLPEMKTPRVALSATAIGSAVYAVGGRSTTKLYSSVLSLDVESAINGSKQSWSKLNADGDVPRLYARAVAIPK